MQVLKTHRRQVTTLPIGPWIARETIWRDPATDQLYGSADLRRLVAPGCSYGYDVVVEVGRSLFVEAQPVRQVIAELAQRHVHLSASTVADLGRRFIVLLALAHRRASAGLQQAMALQGGYILHLDATYEDKSPMLMTGIDAVMEIVLGNVKLPSEKAEGIVPFLRHLQQCFGPPLALVHDMSKGILAAIEEVFPGIPDFICHFHFLRDLGKDLLGAEYDTVRKRLQTHGTVGHLRARLRAWHNQIEADQTLRQTLCQLPVSGWPAQPPAQAPLLAAYLLAHWTLAGLEQGQGYGFPFDRPLLVLARRAQRVHSQLPSLIALSGGEDWRRNLPFHHLGRDLQDLVKDRPLGHTLDRLQSHSQLFDRLRQALHLAPVTGHQGLNHDGESVPMQTLQREVDAFTQQVRARPDYSTTPAFQKMLAQIEHYRPKLFAGPLVISTPQGQRTLQPQRTNNLLERFFRDFKRHCRHKSGCHSLGRTLRSMLADTTLVHNLQNLQYVKILLDGQPTLEALFAQIDPASVREELQKAQQNPERVPRALKRFIANLASPEPIKNLIR
ncbi:MAG: transposase [Limisphaerales bacterium]